jgi:hypothetical protein
VNYADVGEKELLPSRRPVFVNLAPVIISDLDGVPLDE